jgi:Tol biopolymer transport system component
VVRWNGVGRVTTFISATALDAAIGAADLTTSGFALVSVFNPPPVGGASPAVVFSIAPAPGTPGVIEQISLANDGSQPNGHSFQGLISANGRYVAFMSRATNLVQGDTNGADDVFLRDTCRQAPAGCAQSTIRVSVASDGSQGNDSSFAPHISADGRFVLFSSLASNLSAGDTNAGQDVFLRDTCIGAQASCLTSTIRVSVASDGSQGNGPGFVGAMSPDGRFIAFSSDASNLVAGDTNGATDIFLRDTCLGVPVGCTRTTIRVSVADNGVQANSASMAGGFSTDGRFVAFSSTATNLVTSATNGQFQIFVRDTCTQGPPGCQPLTVHASVADNGVQGNNMNWLPVLSVDGRFVGFISRADNLVVGDTNGQADAFWRDTCLGAAGCTSSTARVSVATDGSQGTGIVSLSNDSSWISADGRYVAFSTTSSFGGPDTLSTTLVRDTCANASGCSPTTTRIGVGSDPSLTPDIRFAAITSFSGAIGQFVVSLAQTGLVLPISVPAISSLSPSSLSSGSSEFTLTLDGSGFDAISVVRWNGSDRPTIFVSKTRIQARIPTSDLASAGSAQVTVFNPGTGGGTSNAVTFVVN